MKKTLTILTILVIALVAMVGSVNAASVDVNPSSTQKIAKDQTVSVTLTVAQCQGAQFKIHYDSSKFTYDAAHEDPNVLAANPNVPNEVFVSAMNLKGLTTVTLNFIAKENIEVPAGQKAQTYNFNATDIKLSKAEGEEGTSAPGSLTVNPATPTTPGGEEKPGTQGGSTSGSTSGSTQKGDKETAGKETAGGQKVGTNGEVINKLPQTGAPLYIGAGVAVALAGAVLVIRKIRK